MKSKQISLFFRFKIEKNGILHELLYMKKMEIHKSKVLKIILLYKDKILVMQVFFNLNKLKNNIKHQ